MLGLGECPPGYNPKVHGPYDPAINYGKSKLLYVLPYFKRRNHRLWSAFEKPNKTLSKENLN